MIAEQMNQMRGKLGEMLRRMKQKEYEDLIKIKSLEEINRKLMIENKELKKRK